MLLKNQPPEKELAKVFLNQLPAAGAAAEQSLPPAETPPPAARVEETERLRGKIVKRGIFSQFWFLAGSLLRAAGGYCRQRVVGPVVFGVATA